MSNKLLDIEPLELQFHFELRKQSSCTQYLINKSDNYVAFKVKTTNPKKYCVRPNTGVVPPRSYIEVQVNMQAQKEAPADMKCKDKFSFQCVVASPGTNAKEVTREMFSKEAGNQVEETKLRVVYVNHPSPPVYKGSLPRASVPDDRAFRKEEGNQVEETKLRVIYVDDHPSPPVYKGSLPRASVPDDSAARALITRLTEEKNSAVQLNNRLQQELDQLKPESNKSESGCGILINIKWYFSTLRRKTVKRGEVAYRVDMNRGTSGDKGRDSGVNEGFAMIDHHVK